VAFGHDCVMDPWYGLGSADMLDVAHMGLHVAQMTSSTGIARSFDAVTVNASRVLGLDGYGIVTGHRADFVLLQAGDVYEAIRLKANRLLVVRDGRVLASSPERRVALALPERVHELTLEFRPGSVS
jgi:cytosine deaminase